MSIDLGSEWLKVQIFRGMALLRPNLLTDAYVHFQIGVVAPGFMDMALNKESKRRTPAIIAFRDGQRIFGEDAQTIGLRFPANSFSYLLDLLGKTIDNPIVDQYK